MSTDTTAYNDQRKYMDQMREDFDRYKNTLKNLKDQ
jgi:hypothetical protein